MIQKKLAVVTGAGGGIGRAIAARLRDEGFRVVGIDIKLCPDADVSIEADLTRWPEHEARVTAALEGQSIAALINCAGVQIKRSPVEEVALGELDRLYTHNLRPIVEVTQWALPRMVDGGGIVNIGSISGAASVPGLACYGAVKSAVHSFSRSLARELAPRGIRVNVVAPGYVRTPLTELMLADETRLAEIVSRVPLGSVADGDDIASVVTALFTAPFRYVTGVVLPVDGGYLA
ncbi:SDR family oxidoreductase [Cryobacterium sp. Hh7]|uniref:SDR family NAD(P)-dependent oxidoreductase n=1 Tax=Cryobacterium sp. Hh7 TaxID=1259159 RepID=UPI001069E58A|nr:SDR family oxidoreductase [Cryobacterium sp. Hh7]TFD50719.1 SDR family oxidoreductase [Cryobacterium sp. Hh7]